VDKYDFNKLMVSAVEGLEAIQIVSINVSVNVRFNSQSGSLFENHLELAAYLEFGSLLVSEELFK